MNAESRIAAASLHYDPRPKSAVSSGVGLAGLAGLFAWAAAARAWHLDGTGPATLAFFACGIPMILWSLFVDKVHRSPTTGIDWAAPPRPLKQSLDLSFVKIAGLWTTWAVIGFAYCVARWYWDGVYLFAMRLFALSAIPLLVLSVPYVIWIDRRLKEPRDGAWQFGRLIVGRGKDVNRELLYDHFRSWTIKAFFLAFMVAVAPGNWSQTIAPAAEEIVSSPIRLTQWLIGAMFMIDITMATVGYVLTMKPLDSHIRSANPYAAGWMAALICYPPFVLMASGGPLDYHPGTMGEGGWTYWLGAYPLLMTLFAFFMIALTGIYAWATVAFGIRFSNLTHRGILTHGPYAWTKHPAYVSKNLYWWLATLPFFATTGNPVDMIRNTVVMGLVTGVYYWRARTEERHLMADPAYREYAAWMDRNAPIPRLLRKLRGGGGAPEAVPAE
ncbi:MAG: protein-S-isoprenylcysteine methyltransferase [Alphaproteobacteria bacterium]|nr:MAG: protein-S-isoprenylcysteine methyltransferase [Alphaproteobacteria bacterium]